MDILTDPKFWGDAMLTAAARLAVLAAVVWVARLAIRVPQTAGGPRAATRKRSRTAARESAAGTTADGVPFRYIDLKRAPERKQDSVPAAAQPVDPVRRRLLNYLEQRETERTPA